MPIPYQAGIFDTIVAEKSDVTWASMLESNRGCPHRCTYCDWGEQLMVKFSSLDCKEL